MERNKILTITENGPSFKTMNSLKKKKKMTINQRKRKAKSNF